MLTAWPQTHAKAPPIGEVVLAATAAQMHDGPSQMRAPKVFVAAPSGRVVCCKRLQATCAAWHQVYAAVVCIRVGSAAGAQATKRTWLSAALLLGLGRLALEPKLKPLLPLVLCWPASLLLAEAPEVDVTSAPAPAAAAPVPDSPPPREHNGRNRPSTTSPPAAVRCNSAGGLHSTRAQSCCCV